MSAPGSKAVRWLLSEACPCSALSQVPAVGFRVGMQKVLLSGSKVLYTDFFFPIKKCNSGPSNTIKKNEVYIFPAFLHIDMYLG